MCLVAFQKMFRKIFSSIWLCSWKYHRKHIFYLLLTFSHIFSVVKRIYNIIHSSIQKHKQNPEKKSSNLVTFSQLPNNRNTNKHRNKNIPVKYRNTNIFWVWWGAAIVRSTALIAIGAKARSRSTWCFTRSRSMVRAFAIDALRHHNRREGKIAIGSVLRAILANDLGDRSFGRSRRARLSLWRDRSFGRSLYFRGWALSFSGSLSLLRVEGNGLKVKWICKMISGSNEQNFSQTEIIFQKFYFP